MLKATHIDTGDVVRLFNATQSERSNRGDLKVIPVPGDYTGDVILSDFKSSEGGTITGLASGNRLSNDAAFSNDPLTAVYEYAQRLRLLVPINAGTGWDLTDDPRSETVGVVFNKVRWQKQAREGYTLQYSAEFDVGEGIGDADLPAVASASPTEKAALDGVDLGALETWEEQTKQETAVKARVLEGENDIITKSGPVRRVTINGKATDTRDQIESKVESIKGTDTTVPYESPTGETFQVAVDNYSSVRDSTREGVDEYTLELVEGST